MVRDTHQQNPTMQYLCGLHLNSLNNEEFVNSYIEFAQTYPELCARVIFELNTSHFNQFYFKGHLQQLAMKGFNFALFSNTLDVPKEFKRPRWAVNVHTTHQGVLYLAAASTCRCAALTSVGKLSSHRHMS